MRNHPSIQGRTLVLVGPVGVCNDFLEAHDIDRSGVIIADSYRMLVGHSHEELHIIVMRGVLHWRDPLLRTGIMLLHAQGATVEWA